jgi:hypothetical protein
MLRNPIIRTALLSICFLAAATTCLAQANTQVIYTGKLMGYFRSPSHQNGDATRGCSTSGDSAAAVKFEALRASSPNAILVGSGDNFAPELEARVFDKVPEPEKNRPGNKEVYYWSEDDKKWVYYKDLDKHPDLKARIALGRATIPTDNVGCFLAGARFAAIVPGKHDFYFGPERVRELARFMATLSFDDMKGYGFDSNYHPPQMLGANLVIKTSQIEAPSPISSKPKSKWPDETSIKGLGDGKSVYPWFSSIVRVQLPSPSSISIQKALKNEYRQHERVDPDSFKKFLVDRIQNSTGGDRQDWIGLQESLGQQTNVWICPPPGPNPTMPCEGGWQIGTASLDTNVTARASEKVLAQIKDWFVSNKSFARNEFQDFLNKQVGDSNQGDKDDNDAWRKLSDGFSQLAAKEIQVCPTNKLNEVTARCNSGWPVEEVGLSQDDSGITLSIRIVPKNQPIPTLQPGWNYGLCKINKGSAELGIETKCQTFSVLNPFFSFSRVAPMKGRDYKDPDPFVFIRSDTEPKHEVAIFGVVDPTITQQIGVLNYSWSNDDEKQKTVVSAEDPAEALKEQLDYFESWYQTAHNDHPFEGLKILLAQMSPQRARVLAARLNKFQLVVTEANEEQATSEVVLSTVWNKDTSASPFIAVPAPYYRSGLKETVEGNVHFGIVDAERVDGTAKWKLQSREAEALPVDGKFMSEDEVAKILRPLLKEKCVETKFLNGDNYTTKLDEILRLATLCAIRERLGADVALIQKRDLFGRVPESTGPIETQQLLDRLIWKGDLLTLMYVPGSALKKSLELSKKYDNEDSDNLSLSNEKGRGLEYLGIKKNDKSEYLINEVPLDDKKIYAVATSDYIGAGDTGYPDLAAAALDPKTRAGQFPEKLELISAVVCRKLDPDAKCISEIARDDYLDRIADAPPAQRKPDFVSKVRNLLPFKGPEKTPWKQNVGDLLDQKVQQRSIWMLSLKNFSFQFSGLNNNDTDASIDNKFGGIATSGVNSHENHSIIVGLDLRAVRSKHNYDLFGAAGIDYNTKSSDTSSVAPSVVQNTNRLTGDAGFLWNLWGGRSFVRLGPVFTLHGETQLAQPFTIFNLNTSSTDPRGRTITDQLRISPERSVQLLGRIGLRSQNRTNAFEFGFEHGREFNVFKGYEFVTNGGTLVCKPDATTSLSKCIKDAIKAGTITRDSVVLSAHQDRPRTGLYWKWNISIPFHEKLKFELTDEGDFYFADPARDILNDTRFRDISKSSLKFTVFPNFTIGPSLQLLLYRNQTGLDSNFKPIGGDFLSQKTFGLEASFSFDWFNRREAGVQLRHKP